MYNYREVICPYCNHKYNWMNAPEDGNSYIIYRNKHTFEGCLSSKCPTCNRKSIVSESSAIGIDIDSEDFIISIVRGL